MKYELPKHMKLTRKDKKQVESFQTKLKGLVKRFLLGIITGTIIIGLILLYNLLK